MFARRLLYSPLPTPPSCSSSLRFNPPRRYFSRPCTCGLTIAGEMCDGRSHNRILSLSPSYLRDSAARLASANVNNQILSLSSPLLSEGTNDFSTKRSPAFLSDITTFHSALAMAQKKRGWPRAGFKIGGGIGDEPFFGALCSRDVHRVSLNNMRTLAVLPRVEYIPRGVQLELVAILNTSLPPKAKSELYTIEQVKKAVSRWVPAIAFSGTRIRPPKGRQVQPLLRIADGALHGSLLMIEDAPIINIDKWEKSETNEANEAILSVDDKIVTRGNYASPLTALVWLTNELNRLGLPSLESGDVISTGGTLLTGLTPVKQGASVKAEWCADISVQFQMPFSASENEVVL
jgi:2-keto-4-pentenoate hydratase